MAWLKIGSKTTDANGQVTFDKLPLGSYKYVQTSAKTGYTADATEHPVTISSATPVQETRTNAPTEVSSMQITKYSEGYPDLKLANATFKLMDDTGKTMLTESTGTNASGLLTLSNLMSITNTPQKYKIQEVTAPTNYVKNPSEFEVTVTVGQVAAQSVSDAPTTGGTLEVDLTDSNYTQYTLTGGQYDLYIETP